MRRAGAACAAILVFATAAPLARAQLVQPAAPPSAPAPTPLQLPFPVPGNPPAPTTPAGVALPDIAGRAEDAVKRLQAIAAETVPDDATKAMADGIAARSEDLDKAGDAVDEAIATRAGLDRLLDLERKLGAFRDEIDGWRTLAQKRAEMLESHVTELAGLKETWDATFERARSENAPSAVLDRVKDVRKQTKALQSAQQDARSTALTQQSTVEKLWTRVSLQLDDVARARWEIRGRLLEADRSPLWTAAGRTRDFQSVLDRLRNAMDADLDSLDTFAQLSRERIQLHGTLFAVFLALAVVLRRWARQRRAAGRYSGIAPLAYERPISVALVAAVIASLWLYPHSPLVLNGLLGLLIFVPTILLLFEVFPPELRRLWITIAAFYLWDRVRYLVQSVELLERSLFLLEMIAATALAISLLRASRFEQVARVLGAPRALGRILYAMAAAFAVAAVADMLGFFTLGKVLGEGVLSSVYSAMVLYGAVAIVEPIVPAVLGSRAASSLNAISRYRDPIERWLERAIEWSAIGSWVYIALDRLTLADPLIAGIRWLIGTPVQMGTVAISLGDVLSFGIVVIASMLVSKVLRVLLEEDVLPRTKLGRGIPHAISNTAAYGVFVVGFLLALGAAGIDLSRVTVLAGAFGVGIGFGLQNIVNNFISGLILLYERPIQMGDTVEVGNLTGEVKRIGIRSSTLRTFQGAEVIVPNASLIAERVVNWTLSDRQRRIELPVGVAYGTDPHRVIAILLDVAKASPEVLEDPPPLALFRGFGDSALNFELRVWTGLATYLEVHSRLAIAVNDALRAAEIEIPFPQSEIRIKS